MSKYLFSTILVFLLGTFSLQAQISFQATSNVKEVPVNQVFDVSFTLNGAIGAGFRAPKMDDFRRISGPSNSRSTTMINGKVTKSETFTYRLQPIKVGTFKIKGGTINTGGQTYRSNELTIKVVKGKSFDGTAGTDFFVRAEPSITESYTGQQIIIDYRLYTAKDLSNIDILKESDYAGFFVEPIRRYSNATVAEKINGKDYVSKTIRRVALFPQRAGTFTIEPSQIVVGVVTGTSRRGVFSYKNTTPAYVNTEAVTINVRPLPNNKTADFSGAVGNDFQIEAIPTKNNVTTDDAITLRFSIAGNGDIKRVQPPTLDFGDAFEVYDPKTIDEANYEQQGELYGRKIVEYLILPKKAGNYTLDPKFSYFHPDSSQYMTIQPAPMRIQVRQGSGKKNTNINVSPTEGMDRELRPLKTTTKLRQEGWSFYGSIPFWSLMILPFLGLIGGFIYKEKEAQKANVDQEELTIKSANKVALKRLASAKVFMDKGESKAFYDEISQASLGYVSDKLRIQTADLTKANVREKMQSLHVSPAHIDSFISILQTCEMALFAGMDNSAAMSETYSKAVDVLANVEEEISE